VRKAFANRVPQIAVIGQRPAQDAFSAQLSQYSLKLICHLSFIIATNVVIGNELYNVGASVPLVLYGRMWERK
jgi:hypothetical protein